MRARACMCQGEDMKSWVGPVEISNPAYWFLHSKENGKPEQYGKTTSKKRSNTNSFDCCRCLYFDWFQKDLWGILYRWPFLDKAEELKSCGVILVM